MVDALFAYSLAGWMTLLTFAMLMLAMWHSEVRLHGMPWRPVACKVAWLSVGSWFLYVWVVRGLLAA